MHTVTNKFTCSSFRNWWHPRLSFPWPTCWSWTPCFIPTCPSLFYSSPWSCSCCIWSSRCSPAERWRSSSLPRRQLPVWFPPSKTSRRASSSIIPRRSICPRISWGTSSPRGASTIWRPPTGSPSAAIWWPLWRTLRTWRTFWTSGIPRRTFSSSGASTTRISCRTRRTTWRPNTKLRSPRGTSWCTWLPPQGIGVQWSSAPIEAHLTTHTMVL